MITIKRHSSRLAGCGSDYKPMAVVKNETRKKLNDSLIKSLSQHFKENLTNLPIILTGDRDT
jgi:hypothetical protein